jgi:toxin ParE1/3/4
MSKPVDFSLAAQREFHEAGSYYRQEHADLQLAFLKEVERAVDRIVRLARYLSVLPSAEPGGTKRVFLRHFPYAIYFTEEPERYLIVAVAHSRRRPLYWQGRR